MSSNSHSSLRLSGGSSSGCNGTDVDASPTAQVISLSSHSGTSRILTSVPVLVRVATDQVQFQYEQQLLAQQHQKRKAVH